MNNLFILGSGFDKAICPDLPLNDELLPALIKRFKDPFQVTEFIHKYQTTSIEHILTFLDLEIASSQEGRKKYFENARNWIENSIVQYFDKIRFDQQLSKDWTRAFAEKSLKPNDVIISLNYSCLLDGLLDFYEVWSPWHGYTRHIENGVVSISGDQETGEKSIPDNEAERKNVRLCKIHGSVNFRKIQLLNEPSAKPFISFPIDPSWFPKNAPHSHFGAGIPEVKADKGETIGYIIAPSFIKMPYAQILYMMNDLVRGAREAKTLVIMGCGIRFEDSFLWLLIPAFVPKNYKDPEYESKKLIIIDPNAEAVRQRIHHYFDAEIGGFFESNRTISIEADISMKAIDELRTYLATGANPTVN